MTRSPACCSASESADRAAQLMKEHDVGALPVVEDQERHKLVGIITDRDVALNVVAEGSDPKSVAIEEVMSRELITCYEEDDLQAALKAMADYQVRRIPIINQNREIIGIISQGDLALRSKDPAKLAEVLQEISKPHSKK